MFPISANRDGAAVQVNGLGPSTPVQPISRVRLRRSHVAVACDRCRTQRAKCDNSRPCSNCKSSDALCSDSVSATVSTLSQAHRELARLRSRVQELEKRLLEKAPTESHQLATPPDVCVPETPSSKSSQVDHDVARRHFWKGTHIRTARSANETWYGPSSLHYFIRRAAAFLSSALQQTVSADSIFPQSAAKLLHKPTAAGIIPSRGPSRPPDDAMSTGESLSPVQEEYFLSLYWQSYHTALFPILDETEFKEHYRSLWTGTGTGRQASALVDIILAMCMQYGVSSVPASKQGNFTENSDATVAGRWHYRRCQMLLSNELESPTISTLQCHLLCIIFLCSASFQNMADTACAHALRTAYMLGLHLEPPTTLPLRERELRKRLWWALHLLDTKIGMKLGRPFLLCDHRDMPSLPGDSLEAAMVSGSNFASLGNDATWLSFNRQGVKLFLAAKQAYSAFYGQELNVGEGQTVWDDPKALEDHAVFFRAHASVMDNWASCVPSMLKVKRQNGSAPFSTDCAMLDIEEFAPVWLQRQQIILELMYHNLYINLHRPFVSFSRAATPPPAATESASKAAAHAIALTHIVHQVLPSTTILDGWLEAFQFQWNAAMTLVGFLVAYPDCALKTSAGNALHLSIEIFDIFGNSIPIATSAAIILRDLAMKLDFLDKQGQPLLPAACDSRAIPEQSMQGSDLTRMDRSFFFEDKVSQEAIDMASQEIFDMAVDVDLWSDLDILWQNTGCGQPGHFALAG